MAKTYTTQFNITANTAGSFKAAFSNAAKTMRQTQTYAKSLQKEMDNLKQAYKDGKVDAVNYTKTMDNLTKAYERQQRAAKALNNVEKQKHCGLMLKMLETKPVAWLLKPERLRWQH